MLAAQWCRYCCKQDIADGIQSVEQVGHEEEAVEDIMYMSLNDSLVCMKQVVNNFSY